MFVAVGSSTRIKNGINNAPQVRFLDILVIWRGQMKVGGMI